MKAICDSLPDHDDGSPREWSDWITVGREYQVIRVAADGPNDEVYLQLINDQNQLGFHECRNFTLTDSAIPQGWSVQLDPDGRWGIGPTPFLEPGFWMEYYDDDPEAIATVVRVLGFDPGQ